MFIFILKSMVVIWERKNLKTGLDKTQIGDIEEM